MARKYFITRLVAAIGLPGSILAILAAVVGGCAFNVSYVTKVPAAFSPVTSTNSFTLTKEVKAGLGTGFPTVVKANTVWKQIGATESGEVFTSKDQVLTVEASNIYEAFMVVSNLQLTGFYLPVEKKLCPLARPIALPINSNP